MTQDTDEYPVLIHFETTVTAPSREVAQQATRQTARTMNNDSANSAYALAGVDVGDPDG